MRVNASCAPSKNFCVEEMPDRPGLVLARFFENIEEVEKVLDDKTIKKYNYDEYHLVMQYYNNIEADVEANIDNLLIQAKYEEAENNTIPNLKCQIKTLEEEKKELQQQATDMQLALCDVYEQMLSVASATKE